MWNSAPIRFLRSCFYFPIGWLILVILQSAFQLLIAWFMQAGIGTGAFDAGLLVGGPIALLALYLFSALTTSFCVQIISPDPLFGAKMFRELWRDWIYVFAVIIAAAHWFFDAPWEIASILWTIFMFLPVSHVCRSIQGGEGKEHNGSAHEKLLQAVAGGGEPDSEETQRRIYEEMALTFAEMVIDRVPLIGDSLDLPYPRAELLYALRWLMDYYSESKDLDEKVDDHEKLLSYLFTILGDNWHEIEPEDKAAVERLVSYESFPDWAAGLKEKYIRPERARDEAMEITLRVFEERRRN